MELNEAIAVRRMTRHFAPQEVEPTRLARVLDSARSAPSAGFAQGVDLLVLRAPQRRALFWQLASEEQWRAAAPEAPGLLAAPVIVLPLADPAAYISRYAAPDKAASVLSGRPRDGWPVPYWTVDASFATMLLLLAATDAGLGALFFQLHGEVERLLSGLGVPPGREVIGGLALGHPASEQPLGSASHRPRRRRDDVVHFDTFDSPSSGAPAGA